MYVCDRSKDEENRFGGDRPREISFFINSSDFSWCHTDILICNLLLGVMETSSGAANMSFPFLRLPFEIRYMIYSLLLKSEHEDKIITPDLNGSRRRQFLTNRIVCMSDTMPLLRTCTAIHDEGANVLYGSHIFLFTDEPHSQKEALVPELNLTIPQCDMPKMHRFFKAIGTRNVTRIRHLQLQFYSARFLFLPDRNHDTAYLPQTHANGKYLQKTLELLASHHRLQTFTIVLTPLNWYSYQYFHLSRLGERTFLRYLRKIKGVRIKCKLQNDFYAQSPSEQKLYASTRRAFEMISSEIEAWQTEESNSNRFQPENRVNPSLVVAAPQNPKKIRMENHQTFLEDAKKPEETTCSNCKALQQKAGRPRRNSV